MTHSKQLVRYNTSAGPSGCYSYLHNWIQNQAADPVQFPMGLAKSVFHNEQVIGKTRLVKSDNNVPISIITSHAYFSIDKTNNMQETGTNLLKSNMAWVSSLICKN